MHIYFYANFIRYHTINCRGRVMHDSKLPEGQQYVLKNEHTHAPDARIKNKSEAINNMKRKALESDTSARNIIKRVCKDMDSATAATMPRTSSLTRTIKRIRNGNNCPQLPTNLKDLIISEEYSKCKGEQFLLYDSGDDDNRILIFCIAKNLELLKCADVLLMDGTFDVVPPLFAQLYTIQGTIRCFNLKIR